MGYNKAGAKDKKLMWHLQLIREISY